MATVFYMSAGLIPPDTGTSQPGQSTSYMPAGGPPDDGTPPVSGGSSYGLIKRWWPFRGGSSDFIHYFK